MPKRRGMSPLEVRWLAEGSWHSGKQRTGGPQEEPRPNGGCSGSPGDRSVQNTENGNKDNDICDAHS